MPGGCRSGVVSPLEDAFPTKHKIDYATESKYVYIYTTQNILYFEMYLINRIEKIKVLF